MKNKEIKYPIKFEPILKEKIWGGEKLIKLLGKKSDKKNIGESWEISDVNDDVSVVANGFLKGKTLKEIIVEYGDKLVGENVYTKFGNKFPLLIKFIDAKTPLSIQLHPNDELAKKRHNSFGKTEMWYVMQADKKSNLIVGFKENINSKVYLNHLNNKNLVDILNFEEAKKGDAYVIGAGRVHSIGEGVLLAEIQQASDITYRIYDWDRKDDNGNYRDLHTKQAIDAIDYKFQENYKTSYSKIENRASKIVSCPYYTTNILPINGKVLIDHFDKDSFVIYMCVKGKVTIEYNSNLSISLNLGETVLIPADLKQFSINSLEQSDLLEIFI